MEKKGSSPWWVSYQSLLLLGRLLLGEHAVACSSYYRDHSIVATVDRYDDRNKREKREKPERNAPEQ